VIVIYWAVEAHRYGQLETYKQSGLVKPQARRLVRRLVMPHCAGYVP
jgi:hypothetical protein